jgi:IS5 family transposase
LLEYRGVKQLIFSDVEYGNKRKPTRREVFLAEMEGAVPWRELEGLIEPHYPNAGGGRPPYAFSAMLRIHCLQQWYGLSDPAMEEALYEIASMRRFAGLSLARGALPDETTIVNFRHLLERHDLARRIFEAIKGQLQSKGLMLRQGFVLRRARRRHDRGIHDRALANGTRRCIRRARAISDTSV